MGGKVYTLSILLIVLTVFCSVLGAPVKEHVPPHAKSVELPSHITKGDVMLLKEKLAELEADLDQLEPVVPADVKVDDDEDDEEDIEPVAENVDDEEEILQPAEQDSPVPVQQRPVPDQQRPVPVQQYPVPVQQYPVPVQQHQVPVQQRPVPDQQRPVPVQQQPLEAELPAGNEMEAEPVDEHPEEVGDDNEDHEEDEEPELEDEGDQMEEVEETEGEWEEEEAVNEGILPYVDSEDDDLYLRKLIVQALTVLYRKDADRIDKMLQKYEEQLLEDDIFKENVAPAPQDLMPNEDIGGQKLEASAFAERPFTNEELHEEEVLQAMASKKKQDMNVAEQTLLSDMHTFEGEGITLDELLNDLEQKKAIGQGIRIEPRNELDEEEDALFGEYKEDTVAVDQETAVDEDPALSLQELQEIVNEGDDDEETEDDDDEEENPDDLLMELMANLNTSLKKFQKSKTGPK